MKSLPLKKYKFIYGEIFSNIEKLSKNTDIIIPHVCNNNGKFDSGFASILAKKHPEVKINYELLHNYKLGDNQKVKLGNRIFINMICQNGYIQKNNPRPLNYFNLVKCMADVKHFIKNNYSDSEIKTFQIHCPKFGTGSSGGNWNFISDLIEDVWGDLDVFVYLPKRE
jgi:hypothetical protein